MKTICVDVDGTLIFHTGPDQDPGCPGGATGYTINTVLVEKIKEWSKTSIIIVWSARGKYIAEWAVETLELEKYVSLACAKPSQFVDDQYFWLDRIQKIDPNKIQ